MRRRSKQAQLAQRARRFSFSKIFKILLSLLNAIEPGQDLKEKLKNFKSEQFKQRSTCGALARGIRDFYTHQWHCLQAPTPCSVTLSVN